MESCEFVKLNPQKSKNSNAYIAVGREKGGNSLLVARWRPPLLRPLSQPRRLVLLLLPPPPVLLQLLLVLLYSQLCD